MLLTFRFLALLLSALALTMESAHVLELPQKMRYGTQFYSAVNTTPYRYLAIVGGVYQVGALALAGVLAFLVRHRAPSFQWIFLGFASLLVVFAVWLSVA